MTKITIIYSGKEETKITLKEGKKIEIDQNRFPKIQKIIIDNTKQKIYI